MSERVDEKEGVSCTYCNHFILKDESVCPRCGNVRFASASSERMSVALGSPRDSVRKAVKEGLITSEQGDLLDQTIARACLLDFEKRKQLLVLIKTIAEENDPLKRRELAGRLRHFIGPLSFLDELVLNFEKSFGLR
jgi:predicted  nucleic acid-binding Zn-ribbon protein